MTTEIDGVDLDALNYTELLPYNGTGKQGANPLEFDVNLWYQVGKPPFLLGSAACFCSLPAHATQVAARAPARAAAPANDSQC